MKLNLDFLSNFTCSKSIDASDGSRVASTDNTRILKLAHYGVFPCRHSGVQSLFSVLVWVWPITPARDQKPAFLYSGHLVERALSFTVALTPSLNAFDDIVSVFSWRD